LFDDHIRTFDQGLQAGSLGWIFQVEGDATLAPIEEGEVGAVGPPLGRTAAHFLAATRPLDLHYLRAGFGQQQCRKWSRQQGREVENKQTFEWSHSACFPLRLWRCSAPKA
jgi:hypothetical protein